MQSPATAETACVWRCWVNAINKYEQYAWKFSYFHFLRNINDYKITVEIPYRLNICV